MQLTRDFSFLPPLARRYAEDYFNSTQKDLLTMHEAANFLQISHSTMYRYAKNGTIKYTRLNTYHKFDLSTLALAKSGETISDSSPIEEQEKQGRGRPRKIQASPSSLMKTLAA